MLTSANVEGAGMDVFAYWGEFYNDPSFWQFPMATLAISMAAFLIVALPWTLVAWLDPIPLKKYKIQQKPFEVKKFFLPSLGRILVNNIILAALGVFRAAGRFFVLRHAPIHA